VARGVSHEHERKRWIELSELDGNSLAEGALFIEDRGRAAGRKNPSAKRISLALCSEIAIHLEEFT